jgi:hypothetical protein
LTENELGRILPSLDRSILTHANGSVTNALALEKVDINKLIQSINKKDLAAAGNILLALNDKETLIPVLGVIQHLFLNTYKQTLKPEQAIFIQYIDKVIKNLDYNVNMPLVLFDLFTKFEEAISI